MVAGQPVTECFGDGYLPVLATFRVADLQHPGVDIDVVDTEQAGLRAAQTAGVDRAEQHRHDQVAQRNLGAVVAAVGLREQRHQFPVGVDVGDIPGGPGQRGAGQQVGRHAPPTQPAGQLSHRRGQALQGRGRDAAPPRRDDPRLHRRLGERVRPGELAAVERLEPGQHLRLGVVFVADRAFLGHQGRDRVGQRDAGVHRVTPAAGPSGSRAHWANKPSDDFRYAPVAVTDW